MTQDARKRNAEPRWALLKGVQSRGFTMVELMVSVVLLGLISGVIWSLFASTSGAMQEADSLADTLDRSRFALDQVSADVRSAGAYASPDSDHDPWALPRPNGRRIVGIASYAGWQDNQPWTATAATDRQKAIAKAHSKDQATAGAPLIGFDGFIVIGALDYSTTFEIRNMQFTTTAGGSAVTGFAIGGRIPLSAVGNSSRFAERGLKKLIVNDPFFTSVGLFGNTPSSFTNENHPLIEPIYEDLGTRLLRVMDRQGYQQFGAFSSDNPTWSDGISFNFVQPGLQTKISGRPFGLQPPAAGDQDVGYEAALIDAYWYHVEPDPEENGNYQLVRDRLDADEITQLLAGDWSSITETNLLASGPMPENSSGTTTRERIVITDRLVDFQIWFDCADGTGTVDSVAWQTKWVTPTGETSDTDHNCVGTGQSSPGKARVAHIRMSIRTEHERKELGHQGFFDETGSYNDEMALQTYDLNPSAPGATRVVTVQTDIELTNFSYKNVTQ